MSLRFLLAVVAACLAALACTHANATKRTVCTITVNSADEKEAFRRHLPPGDYDFVELVERGKKDWLASACQQRVSCDVLVVSGHFNGEEFFSDRLDASEYLPVAEMERASCSNSCPGLFSKLKEVYLFGCTSLNGEANRSASDEVERSLLRSGHSRGDAERVSRQLSLRHAESNRDVMRRIFVDVPAIYGFSSTAPVGPTAGALINRYFDAGGARALGSGRPNQGLLAAFARNSMTLVGGLRNGDPGTDYRAQVCQFVDDRLTPAAKLRNIHRILGGEMAEARLFFDRIEGFLAAIDERERNEPEFAQALTELAGDRAARDRYLAFARDADQPRTRARMLDVARTLAWLSPDEYRSERVQLVRNLLDKPAMLPVDVDLVCSLHDRDALRSDLMGATPQSGTRADRAAAMACLGDPDARATMLLALASADEGDRRMAELYFHHRPLAQPQELRSVVDTVARMTHPDSQVRALGTLARVSVSDAATLAQLGQLFARVESASVQSAVAGVLVRADYRVIATPEFVGALRTHRVKGRERGDIVDMLIRRLESSDFYRDRVHPSLASGPLHDVGLDDASGDDGAGARAAMPLR